MTGPALLIERLVGQYGMTLQNAKQANIDMDLCNQVAEMVFFVVSRRCEIIGRDFRSDGLEAFIRTDFFNTDIS